MLHWCDSEEAYLTIPVDVDEQGRRIGECPYCGRLVWDDEPPRNGPAVVHYRPNHRRRP